MIPTLTALLQTITGKAILGLTVATASVGAAAAGAPVPIVQELVPGAEHAAVPEGRPADTTWDDLDADGSGPDVAAAAAVGAADADDGEGAADEPNHGAVVSEFATTTELEGCERGQAVSAVARGELDPASETFDADLATYLDELDKCNDTDDEADDEADDAEEGAADEPNHGAVVSEFATTTELEGCERGQAVSAVARGELDPASETFDADLATYLDELDKCNDTDDADDAAETEGAADEPNHGAVVSEFATTTELEGCERGQAVSAVARGELDPASETFDADLATYLDELDKCNDTDEEPAEDGARGGPPADKPAGKSAERGNRPDHAGSGKP